MIGSEVSIQISEKGRSRTLPRVWCHHMVSGCTLPRLSMLATFTPEELPPHCASFARTCAARSGKCFATQCRKYTPSASLLPVVNSLFRPRCW